MKPQVQLVIAVGVGVALGRGMTLTGGDGGFQRDGPVARQAAGGQSRRLTLQFGMHLQYGQEFLDCRAKDRGPLARQAAHQTQRFQLQDRFADRGARHAKGCDQFRLVDQIAGVQLPEVDPVKDMLDKSGVLPGHPALSLVAPVPSRPMGWSIGDTARPATTAAIRHTTDRPASSADRMASASAAVSTSGGDRMMLVPDTRTMAPAR